MHSYMLLCFLTLIRSCKTIKNTRERKQLHSQVFIIINQLLLTQAVSFVLERHREGKGVLVIFDVHNAVVGVHDTADRPQPVAVSVAVLGGLYFIVLADNFARSAVHAADIQIRIAPGNGQMDKPLFAIRAKYPPLLRFQLSGGKLFYE